MKSVLETSLYLIIMSWMCIISVQFIVMNSKITKVNEISTYIENFVEAKGEGNSTNDSYPTYTYKNVVKVKLTSYKKNNEDLIAYTFRDEETKKQYYYDDNNENAVVFKVADIGSDGKAGAYTDCNINDPNYKYILDYKDYSKYETWYSATENNAPYVCVFKKDSNGNSRKEETPVNVTADDFYGNKQSVNDFDYTRVFIHYTDNFKSQLDQLVDNYKKQGYDVAFSYYDTTNNYGYISYSINYQLTHSFFKFSTDHKFNGIARFPITGVVGSH